MRSSDETISSSHAAEESESLSSHNPVDYWPPPAQLRLHLNMETLTLGHDSCEADRPVGKDEYVRRNF